MSTKRMIAATGWRFHRHGAPAKVLQLEKYRLPFDRTSSEVVVKMLAAPVHRHDRSVIQGSYPIRKTGVAGVEGVGIVEEVGSNASIGVQEGDLVWINNQAVGTWASHVVTDAANVDVLPNRADLEIEYLASMSLFHTAYHITNSHVKLQPGDVVLQTGATSSIAQICQTMVQARGAKLFQTMRLGRADHTNLVNSFKSRGATAVFPYNYARTANMKRLLSDLPPPKLLLNHVGGSYASDMVKLLGDNGTVVTYGNTSGKPMQLPAVDLMRRNLTFKHFFLPNWIAANSREARMRVHQNVVESMTLTQASSNFRAQRYKMDQDSHFAFTEAWAAPLNQRKPILRMVGEYGEWRRPTSDHATFNLVTSTWEDLLQETTEAIGASDQPQSMKYYTPFGDFYSDFKKASESREMGFREVFFRRPNAPRHNAAEATQQ